MQHSEGHRYRVVALQTDVFETFYAIVFYPPASYRSLYDAGAPVVVSSMQSIGIVKSWASEPRAYIPVNFGVVEVQPVHPGWVAAGYATPGNHDAAGPQTADSLAVALDFALGRITTVDGLHLRDLVNRDVCTGALAVLGASSGGITAARTLSEYKAQLQGRLVGMSFYETPSLPLFVVGDTGFKALDRAPTEDTDGNGVTWDEGRSPGFLGCSLDTLECEQDLSTLAWSDELSPASVAPAGFVLGAPGVLYLDRNESGRLELDADGHPDVDGDGLIGPDEDYYLLPYQEIGEGGVERQLHSPAVAQAAVAVFGSDGRPTHLASAAEARAFWTDRNAVKAAGSGAAGLSPEVRFSVVFTEEDHSVPVAERPHVAVLYAALGQAGASVRTNLERDAAVCLVGESALEGWPGGGITGADWELDGLLETAMPSTLPLAMVPAIATLGLFWDAWGPFDLCPGLSSR
jgi:hypothetical protein